MFSIRYAIFFLMLLWSWAAGQQQVANTNDAGEGSLRQAIANADNGGTITFALGLSGGTIILTSGELNTILNNLTIDASALASPITINANNNFRIFFHGGNGTFAINNLVVTQGRAAGVSGGGIFSSGNVTVTNSTISGNNATLGGGIRGFMNLTLSGCARVISNTAGTGKQWRLTGTVNGGDLANTREDNYQGPDCPASVGGVAEPLF